MISGLYFDYCATTPIHPDVLEVMQEALGRFFGNPSSLHSFGQQARALVEQARAQVAEGIGADPDEILFTSGATEANNLALMGVMRSLPTEKQHLITSRIEHHAVLHTAEALARQGCAVTYLPVDGQGLISLPDLEKAIQQKPGLVSIMMVNNEVGSLQNISEFGKLAKKHDVILHTDAVQAANCYKLDVDELRVDLLSLSAHKIYGPKGVGALYVRKGTPLEPILYGGAQEAKRRPGTENVAGIVGLGAAMALRNDDYSARYRSLSILREILVGGLRQIVSGVEFNGPAMDGAPHIVSVSFPDVDGELLLFELNREGVAVSMGSACTSESIEPSHVLTAMNVPDERIDGTLRISLGIQTTAREIEELLSIMKKVVEKAHLLMQ